MIDGALRAFAVAATLLVALGFFVFAADQLQEASRTQQNEVVDTPTTAQSPAHGVRKTIDDVSGTLRAPFDGVVDSHSDWVTRGVPTLIALLVYGLGLGFLARYLNSRT